MFKMEPYLDDLNEYIGRRLKTLCRLNTLPLQDKIGKQLGKWRPGSSKWHCPLCTINKTPDNLIHYFLDCPSLHFYRLKLLTKVEDTLTATHNQVRNEAPGELPPTYEDFTSLNKEDQLQILLGKQINAPKAEAYIDLHVKRFLRKTWKLRRPHVEKANRLYQTHHYLITN